MQEGLFKKEKSEEEQEQMSCIEDEEKISRLFALKRKKFFSKLYKREVELVLLTVENVARVEAMIRTDSAYRRMFDEKEVPICKRGGKFELKQIDRARDFSYKYNDETKGQVFQLKYGGSTAYWMKQIKEACKDDPRKSLSGIKYLVGGLVLAIDRENSTHLNAKGNGREVLVDRIVGDCRTFEGLIKRLKTDDLGKNSLLQLLAEPVNKARANLSFASKFCHYASYYLLDGEDRDRYSIFDSFVGRVVPCYLERLEEEKANGSCWNQIITKDMFVNNKGKKKKIDYPLYHKAIADLLTMDEEEAISRNGFDHLVWYFHKGRDL